MWYVLSTKNTSKFAFWKLKFGLEEAIFWYISHACYSISFKSNGTIEDIKLTQSMSSDVKHTSLFINIELEELANHFIQEFWEFFCPHMFLFLGNLQILRELWSCAEGVRLQVLLLGKLKYRQMKCAPLKYVPIEPYFIPKTVPNQYLVDVYLRE